MRRSVTRVFLTTAFCAGLAASVQAAPTGRAQTAAHCDRTCLIGFANRYMDALAKHDPSGLPWARTVEYSENSVPMMIGDGQWGTITWHSPTPLYAADPSTGNVAWFGLVKEHGQPAYYGMRLKVEHGKIAEIEAVINGKGEPGPFGKPDQYRHDPSFNQVLKPSERVSRKQLIALANGYYSTMQRNDGTIRTKFDPDCERTENGISTTKGKFGAAAIAQGCAAQFKLGLYKVDDNVRARRYPIVDVKRGVVVATGFIDHAARFQTYKTTDGKTHKIFVKYPNSLGFIEAFKIRAGKIYRIEAIFTMLPYGMKSPWLQ